LSKIGSDYMELQLNWEGHYPLDVETPKGLEGLHGLFAYLFDSEIVYIGRSSGKYHLFQESKFRYKPLKRALIRKRVFKPPLEPITTEDRIEIEKIAKIHCKKYVGILHDENKVDFLNSAENLLVSLKKPDGNDKLKKAYKGVRPFKLINKGEKSTLAALGLEESYEIL